MLLNLHKTGWENGLALAEYGEHTEHNEKTISEMLELAKLYKTSVEEEDKLTKEELAIKNVGKQDPKRHLEAKVSVLMSSNIVQCLGAMVNTVIFD